MSIRSFLRTLAAQIVKRLRSGQRLPALPPTPEPLTRQIIIKKRSQARRLFPIEKLMHEFNSKCYHCGFAVQVVKDPQSLHDLAATRDHMIPLSLGGTNAPDNVVLSCRGCNFKKGNTPDLSRVGWVSSNTMRQMLEQEFHAMIEWHHERKKRNNPNAHKRRAKSHVRYWFAGKMELPIEASHLTNLTREQCEKALGIVKEYRERKGF